MCDETDWQSASRDRWLKLRSDMSRVLKNILTDVAQHYQSVLINNDCKVAM